MNKTITAPERSGELLRAGQILTVTGNALVEWIDTDGKKLGPIAVDGARRFGPYTNDLQVVISAISGSVSIVSSAGDNQAGVESGRYDSMVDFNAAGGPAGHADEFVGIAGQLYWCDGVVARLLGKRTARIIGIRPKLASFGNSINGQNKFDAVNFAFHANGVLTWIHALSGAAFDRCRSVPKTFGAPWPSTGSGFGSIDKFGCYSWGGADLANDRINTSMLRQFDAVCNQLLDAPDIIYLGNLLENDIANSILTAPVVTGYLQRAIDDTIKFFRARYPSAVIILAQPGPSTFYDTAAKHAIVDAMRSYIAALSNRYDDLYIETNTATTIQDGEYDQPITSYYPPGDGVHYNERGALVRAKAFIRELGWLLPNQLEINGIPYDSGIPGVARQKNPRFSITGSGMASAGHKVLDNRYASFNFWEVSGTDIGCKVAAAVDGINIGITTAAAQGARNGIIVQSSDGSSVTVDRNEYFYAVCKLIVTNPANLFGILFEMSFNGGVAIAPKTLNYQGLFPTEYPQGLSDILEVGDELTLQTPLIMAGDNGSANTTIYSAQIVVYSTASLPPGGDGVIGPHNPAINIQVMQAQRCAAQDAAGKAVTITSGGTYTNNTTETQSLLVTGNATWTSIIFANAASSYSLTASNQLITIAPGNSVTPTWSAGIPIFTIFPTGN